MAVQQSDLAHRPVNQHLDGHVESHGDLPYRRRMRARNPGDVDVENYMHLEVTLHRVVGDRRDKACRLPRDRAHAGRLVCRVRRDAVAHERLPSHVDANRAKLPQRGWFRVSGRRARFPICAPRDWGGSILLRKGRLLLLEGAKRETTEYWRVL